MESLDNATSNRGPYTSLFLFDSNRIDAAVPGSYGAWAEAELLRSLGAALQPYGGFPLLSRTISGCHGDMFRGEYRRLCQWAESGTYGNFRVAVDLLDPALLDDLRSRTMTRDLFAVGLSPLYGAQLPHRIHEDLRRRTSPDYYKGATALTGEPSLDYLLKNTDLSREYMDSLRATSPREYETIIAVSRCPFISDTAEALGLLCIGIEVTRRGRCKGWLPNRESLVGAGLTPD